MWIWAQNHCHPEIISIFIKMLEPPKELTQVIGFYPPPTVLNIYRKSVGPNPFIAACVTKVSAVAGHSSLPESIGHAKKPRVHVAPTVDISSQKFLGILAEGMVLKCCC